MAILNINRGTTYIISYQHQHDGANTALTGATVFFTIKSAEYDSDATGTSALVSKTLSGASLTDAAAGQTDIEIEPADTSTITPGEYFYDIKVKESDGRIYKMDEGTVVLDGSPTNRQS